MLWSVAERTCGALAEYSACPTLLRPRAQARSWARAARRCRCRRRCPTPTCASTAARSSTGARGGLQDRARRCSGQGRGRRVSGLAPRCGRACERRGALSDSRPRSPPPARWRSSGSPWASSPARTSGVCCCHWPGRTPSPLLPQPRGDIFSAPRPMHSFTLSHSHAPAPRPSREEIMNACGVDGVHAGEHHLARSQHSPSLPHIPPAAARRSSTRAASTTSTTA